MPGDFLSETSVFAISENTTIPLGRTLKLSEDTFRLPALGLSDLTMVIILSNIVYPRAAKREGVLRDFRY